MVSLESCDCLSRHRSELPVDRAGVVTVPLQLCLHVDHDLVRRQIALTIDRTVVRIVSVSVLTPRRIPVTPVPEIPASANKDDAVVVAGPPPPIMPLPVVISNAAYCCPLNRLPRQLFVTVTFLFRLTPTFLVVLPETVRLRKFRPGFTATLPWTRARSFCRTVRSRKRILVVFSERTVAFACRSRKRALVVLPLNRGVVR